MDDQAIGALKAFSGVLENGFERESLIQYQSTSEIAKAWAPMVLAHSSVARRLYQSDKGICASALYKHIDEVCQNTNVTASALPFAETVLKALKERGFVLGIATADTWLSTVKSLKEAGLFAYFDFFGFDDGKTHAKPDPALGKAFEKATALKPQEYIVVGDSLSDYEFSKNCGVAFVGMRSGYGQLSALEEEVLLIHSLDELLEVLCE